MDQQYKNYFQGIPKAEAEPVGSSESDGNRRPPIADKIDFHLKPEELEKYLNDYIVDQPEAVEVLATKICTHFNRMRLEIEEGTPSDATLGNIKANILMIGPTGVGKTYLIKLIANRIGVPFVKGDATKFSETGYVGGDVEDLVRELVHEAGGSIALAEYGIIYIDEIDKIASVPGNWGPDVSRSGVQRNLLKLMEETEVDLKVPHDLASQMEAVMQTQRTGKAERRKVNTRNILFVVSGAFDGLSERIAKRLAGKHGIGFKSDGPLNGKQLAEVLRQVTTRDLMDFGFESEFIGRLPVSVVLNELNENSLHRILSNHTSAVIRTKKREFRAYGIELDFEDEALRIIAKQAALEKTGARGLLSAIERILVKFEKRLPTVGVKSLTVSSRLIEQPQDVMREIVFQHTLEKFTYEFHLNSGVQLTFQPELRQQLFDQYTDETELSKVLQETLKDYVYGVKLMGVSELEVNAEMMKDPAGVLDLLIKVAYENRAKKA
jgi:endopeptidase Clp ATP-binding regulatory subunit ClpX